MPPGDLPIEKIISDSRITPGGTRYSNIPKPVLVKLGNPDRIRFSIRGDTVVVEGANG